MAADTTLDAFHLSRVGARAEHDGMLIEADRALADSHGLLLSTTCDGAALSLWTTEADWRAWLVPQLTVGELADIEAGLLPVLAAWTLAPLDGFLRAQGLPGLAQAAVQPAPAPGGECWRLTLRDGPRRLPLYLRKAPRDWLAALRPSREQTHQLALGLGWCLLPEQDWDKVAIGDALPIHGMADALDTLWLHPEATPGRLRLIDAERAVMETPSSGLDPAPSGTLRLIAEAAAIRVSADALADWEAGREIDAPAAAHPMLRLTAQGRLWAQGQLLRLDDGWAARILARG
ncbi:hypothetical protein [Pseudogulbenkiania ferrooxidans]|uniref:Type III secretion system protein n=1 Tax=Pseudogulbenkiania ferrooxidans EGD-HP2 TaxID=1388764 RepID=A0ABN0NBQ1_9NEIS|nr:hypothetical protein [Pseudogulbenkiania ferrooxidans]ERE19478.1 hypothetical protein O166_20150 [Pseudogulbenkiania ferrooxidans EGD-HP2]